MTSDIWAITPCMGRLTHLKQSLPPMLGAGLSVVLVDYSCPDGCGAWAHTDHYDAIASGHLFLELVAGKRRFSKSGAFNVGARAAVAAGAAHLCFIDCDTLVTPQFGAWCREHATVGTFHVFQPTVAKKDLYGCLLVSARDYLDAGGYDEEFYDWGMEDMDMRLKLRLKQKLSYDLIPAALATPVTHSDHLRTQFYAERNPKVSSLRNYRQVRRHVKRWTGRDLNALRELDLRPLLGHPS